MTSNAWTAIAAILVAALAFLSSVWWIAVHITRLEVTVISIKETVEKLPCETVQCPFSHHGHEV